jgi:hypothetical protein
MKIIVQQVPDYPYSLNPVVVLPDGSQWSPTFEYDDMYRRRGQDKDPPPRPEWIELVRGDAYQPASSLSWKRPPSPGTYRVCIGISGTHLGAGFHQPGQVTVLVQRAGVATQTVTGRVAMTGEPENDCSGTYVVVKFDVR